MFGFSFGKKKQTSNSTTNLNKTEATTQNQDSTKASVSDVSSSGSSSQSGSTTQQQAGTNQSQTQQATQQRTQQFSDATLGSLEDRVSNLLNDTTLGSTVRSSLEDMGDFDAGGFVSSSVAAASSREQSGLEEFLGGLQDSIGSAASNNSMSALLATRAQGDAAARVEGVRANATQTAAEIARNQALAKTQIAGAEQDVLGSLLANLKGGVSATEGSMTGAETGATTNTSAGTSQMNATEQQQQTTRLVEALSQLLTGNITTNATENATNKTKNSGGGFSLSL